MNENAKKWVEKLREPGLRQTTGRLENEKGQCCLGVACALYKEEYPNYITEKKEGKNGEFVMYYDEYSTLLPNVIKDWLGLKDNMGTFAPGLPDPMIITVVEGVTTTEELTSLKNLMALNDYGATFEMIARVIREYEKELFTSNE